MLCRSTTSKIYPAMYIENVTELAFDDVSPEDPDFPSIQGEKIIFLTPLTVFSQLYKCFWVEPVSLVCFSTKFIFWKYITVSRRVAHCRFSWSRTYLKQAVKTGFAWIFRQGTCSFFFGEVIHSYEGQIQVAFGDEVKVERQKLGLPYFCLKPSMSLFWSWT